MGLLSGFLTQIQGPQSSTQQMRLPRKSGHASSAKTSKHFLKESRINWEAPISGR